MKRFVKFITKVNDDMELQRFTKSSKKWSADITYIHTEKDGWTYLDTRIFCVYFIDLSTEKRLEAGLQVVPCLYFYALNHCAAVWSANCNSITKGFCKNNE